MKETWRQQLRQKLADYEEPDPLMSWEELEKALPKQQPSKVVRLWGRRIAAAAAILLIGGAAVLYLRQRETAQVSEMPTAAAPTIETPQQPTEEPRQNILQKMVTHMRQQNLTAMTPPKQTIGFAFVRRDSAIQTRLMALAAPSVAVETEAEPVLQQAPADTPADTTTAEVAGEAHQRQATQPLQTYTQYDTHTKKPNSSTRLLTAKLFYSNSLTGRQTPMAYASPDNMIQGDPTNQNGPDKSGYTGDKGDTTPSGNTPDDEDNNDEDNKEARTRLPMTTRNSSSDKADIQQSEQVSHRQPIRFGLLLRYQLSNRWALESGLTYTRLTADITRRIPGIRAVTIDQSLNYIGIPLSASYLIYKSRHLGFYASGGMLVEKMVYGSRTEAGSRQSVSIGPLQLSVNAGLGAEYRFIPALSVFVEPGIGYYFDNGSSVPTFYQEKPLSFNLNLGLRFCFE